MLDTETMIPSSEDSTSTVRAEDRDRIETSEERREHYRKSLVTRQQGRKVRLKPMLLWKKQHFRQLDAHARRRHLQKIDELFHCFDGDMYVEYNEAGHLERLDSDGDFRYVVPVMNGHIGEAFMQLLRVNPEWVFTAKDNSDDNMNRLARMCEQLGPEELDRLMREDERQTETLNSILTGDSHREIDWAVHPKSPKKAKRIEQKRVEVEVPGRRECLNCQSDVPEGAETCGACGVTGIRDIPAGVSYKFESAETEVSLGENVLRIPHPMAAQSDLSVSKFEDSTFLIVHETLYRHTASWLYQTLIDNSAEGFSEEAQARFNADRSLALTDYYVGNRRARARDDGNRVERERHFWDVSEYGQMYCEVEEQLPNPVPDPFNPGKMTDKIPAGTILGDFFPAGLHVTYLGDTVVHSWPVDKTRRWIKITYGKRPGSSTGQGARLIALLNDIVNDDFNLVHAVKHTSARPFTVVAGQSVKLLPESRHFLRIDRLPPGVSDIRGAIAQYPGQAVAGMDSTNVSIQQAMQFIMGTYTLGPGGAPDAQGFGGTATEVTARVEQASGRQIGPIGQRIAADRETILICLENIRDYSSPEQRKELEKRFGPDITELFFTCDFRRDLNLAVKPNTDIPRSLAMTQAGRLAFAQAAANIIPIAQQAPWAMEFLEGLADAYGFPLSLGPGRSDRREAERRLNKLNAIEERLEQKSPGLVKANPLEAAQKMYAALVDICPMVAPEEDDLEDVPRVFLLDHQTFMDAYKDELLGEKAAGYSRARKLVIIKLWEDHFFAQLGQKEELARVQQQLQAMLNPQPAQPSPEEMQAAQDGQDARTLTQAAIEQEAEEESRDNEMARSETAKESDHRRALEFESHRAANAAELERVRAEGRPPAAGGGA